MLLLNFMPSIDLMQTSQILDLWIKNCFSLCWYFTVSAFMWTLSVFISNRNRENRRFGLWLTFYMTSKKDFVKFSSPCIEISLNTIQVNPKPILVVTYLPSNLYFDLVLGDFLSAFSTIFHMIDLMYVKNLVQDLYI